MKYFGDLKALLNDEISECICNENIVISQKKRHLSSSISQVTVLYLFRAC